VVADEPRIRQVLANLLANVREHTPAGTPVALRLSAAGEGALIEVADAGPGMSPADAARAFDRFHRGTQNDGAGEGGGTRDGAGMHGAGEHGARKDGGSGLGLSIVQAIAVAHNGHTDLASAPGQGTQVRVWLPAGPVAYSDEETASLRRRT